MWETNPHMWDRVLQRNPRMQGSKVLNPARLASLPSPCTVFPRNGLSFSTEDLLVRTTSIVSASSMTCRGRTLVFLLPMMASLSVRTDASSWQMTRLDASVIGEVSGKRTASSPIISKTSLHRASSKACSPPATRLSLKPAQTRQKH